MSIWGPGFLMNFPVFRIWGSGSVFRFWAVPYRMLNGCRGLLQWDSLQHCKIILEVCLWAACVGNFDWNLDLPELLAWFLLCNYSQTCHAVSVLCCSFSSCLRKKESVTVSPWPCLLEYEGTWIFPDTSTEFLGCPAIRPLCGGVRRHHWPVMSL